MDDEGRLPDAAFVTAAPAAAPATGPADEPAAAPAPETWEVLARFRSSEALDHAIMALEAGGFGRGDLGLPEMDAPVERATPEAGSKAADTEVENQQSRVAHSAIGGSVAAMIAATAVAATGGVAAAVAGAALGAGAAAVGLSHLLSHALSHSERATRERLAAEGRLVLAVRTASPEKREHACEVLRQTGGELL